MIICPIIGTLTGTTTPGPSGPESNDKEEVLPISQSSKIGALPSSGFESYTRHSVGVVYNPSQLGSFSYG